MKRFTLAVLVTTVAIGLGTGAMADVGKSTCKPLIVFYSGGLAKNLNTGLWKFCKGYKPPKGVVKRCKTWDQHENKFILNHWRGTRKRTPVVLVGHSYGGDTAYDVAGNLPRAYKPTLVTLDPVGKIVLLYGRNIPKPTRGKWVNVYRRAKDYKIENSIAWLGQSWRRQRRAQSILYRGDHNDVQQMFSRARKTIANALSCGR